MMDFELYIDKLNRAILALLVGTEFVLKDMFSGVEWNQFENGGKRNFGCHFKYWVAKNKSRNFNYVGKMPNNSAYYIRVDD